MKEVNYNIQECANELIKLRAEQCRHAKVMDNFWDKIDARKLKQQSVDDGNRLKETLK